MPNNVSGFLYVLVRDIFLRVISPVDVVISPVAVILVIPLIALHCIETSSIHINACSCYIKHMRLATQDI